MPTNARMIEIHLEDFLRSSGQAGNVDWGMVMGYCIGYYKEITLDHVIAIQELITRGLIKK